MPRPSVHRWFSSRLFLRIAATSVLASVVPLAAAAWFALAHAEETLRTEAERRLALRGELVARLVHDSVERAQEKLDTVGRLLGNELASAAAPSADLDAGARVAQRLEGLVDPPDVFLRLQYYAGGPEPRFLQQRQQAGIPNNDPLAGENAAQILSNIRAELVQEPVFGNRAFRSTSLESVEGRPTLAISTPVARADDVEGALVAYVDFTALCGTLASLASGSTASRSNDVVRIEVHDDAGTPLCAAGQPAIDPITVATPVEGTAWTVRTGEPRAIVFAPLERLRLQTRLALAAAVLLALLGSVVLAAWIARPVQALESAAAALERGELGARSGVRRSDELGRFAQAFDRMAASLEQLDQAKSSFVANVSHELRTPLTSMRLTVENLRDGVHGPLEAQVERALERLLGELDRTGRLVEDLLELARIEAGAATVRRDEIDLAALARGAIRSFEDAAARKRQRIELEGSGRARADGAMIQRVLGNLLDNAIKFAPAGTRVTVRVADGELRVSDEGPGVPSTSVFEPFRRGEDAAGAGVGLGLALVRKLVELNGGSVRVENHAPPRPGATFVVELAPRATVVGAIPPSATFVGAVPKRSP